MKNTLQNAKDNILGSKVTSGIGAAIAVLSLLGLQGDPATAEAVHQWLIQHGAAIGQIVAVVALLLAKDPQVLAKPKNASQVSAEAVVTLTQAELLKLIRENNKNPQKGEE